ncbi:family 16 glycosylhydrolase [Azohydromonas caseinilytica]|uniref:Beta-glucanase n=1 Tax=Azohydromonas caseinilytica TaxID=2728836 RepID=A0A848FDD1_9BURK|nr:family 16 glycosylhydrolase [Azohydromonas caseinilytica]NML16399.1 family 16 glycosylhydrolase [Azohydromonas caseinilytica]
MEVRDTGAVNESAAVAATTLETPAEVAAGAASFSDELLSLDSSRWQAAQWNNGSYFLNGWHPDQLDFAEGRLRLTLEADVLGLTGLSCVSGEYRTLSAYGHGLYQARLKASGTPGTITGFFTYTGPAEGTQHDEIDIEIKGDDPWKLQVNYWTDDAEHPTVIDLGFDASAGYHDYAFRWTGERIQWFVDGRLVHEEDGRRGPLPQVAGRLMLNLWGATGAEPWSSSYQVSGTPSEVLVERVAFTAEQDMASATVPAVSVGALYGRTYWETRNSWRAVATIGVRDAGGAAVPGAVVSGSFSGGALQNCTTDGSGACSVSSGLIGKGQTGTTFTLAGLSGSGMSYDAAGNVAGSVVMRRP